MWGEGQCIASSLPVQSILGKGKTLWTHRGSWEVECKKEREKGGYGRDDNENEHIKLSNNFTHSQAPYGAMALKTVLKPALTSDPSSLQKPVRVKNQSLVEGKIVLLCTKGNLGTG